MEFLDKDVVACLDEVVLACFDKENKGYFDVDIRNSLDDCYKFFSSYPPWYIFLEESWVDNV